MGSRTLGELLNLMHGICKLSSKPTVSMLSKMEPLEESPNGSIKAYPNGYAAYTTMDGNTVVWIAECEKYPYKCITLDELLALPWYIAVALAGEDTITNNVLNRTGDRAGTKSEIKGEKGEGLLEASERWVKGVKYETPECHVMRIWQIKIMLNKLSPMQRETLILHDFYGYTEVEIAHMRTLKRRLEGDHREYSRACVSKQLNDARFRLDYRRVPF